MSEFVGVLDASALLAVLNQEAGAGAVAPLLDGAAISAVNWSETVQKALARGVSIAGLRLEVEALGVTIVPFGAGEAEEVAELLPQTTHAGLSLGDRACLALARREAVPAVTTDRAWTSVSIGVEVRVIR
jgi:ribonuclease VapC